LNSGFVASIVAGGLAGTCPTDVVSVFLDVTVTGTSLEEVDICIPAVDDDDDVGIPVGGL
jgi:hypothetical protein